MGILDGQDLPSVKTTDVGQLADVLRDLATLADEIDADLVTADLRLAQYRRVATIGEWLTAAADRLHYTLDRETNPDDYEDR